MSSNQVTKNPAQINNSNSKPQNANESIKELKLKLKSLTTFLLEERGKNSDFISRIKELESEVEKSGGQLDNLNTEKYELQSELSRIKNPKEETEDIIMKDVVNKFFNKDKINFDKFDEVKEAISSFKYENRKLQQNYSEIKELHDQQKIKFDTMVQIEEQKYKDLESKVEKYKGDIDEHFRQRQIKEKLKESQDKMKEKYIQDCKQIVEEQQKLFDDLQKCKRDKELLELNIKANSDKVHALYMEIHSSQLKKEKLEEALKPKKLGIKEFQVEAIEGIYTNEVKKTIKFYKDETKYEVMMEICGTPFKITQTRINPSKSSPKKIHIEITGGIKITVTFDELVVDYFYLVYEEYYDEAKNKPTY